MSRDAVMEQVSSICDTWNLTACKLCPRRCGVNRITGERGLCGESAQLRVARAALHLWEEPCLCGAHGAGTVFFSGCALGCVYCQNRPISHGDVGKEISSQRLAEIFLQLQAEGAANIDLVTPDHFVPQIAAALECAKLQGLSLPVVWNSSGYALPETLRALEGLVDIYMPDYKYTDALLAKQYSAAADYPEVAFSAIQEMVRQQPFPAFAEDGLMQQGVLIRLLLLPDALADAKASLTRLYAAFGDQVWFSLMDQYTPMPWLSQYPILQKRVEPADYEALIDHAVDLGIEQAYVQEGGAAEESFIPDFDLSGV